MSLLKSGVLIAAMIGLGVLSNGGKAVFEDPPPSKKPASCEQLLRERAELCPKLRKAAVQGERLIRQLLRG